jgi:RHS repeat-associated protein
VIYAPFGDVSYIWSASGFSGLDMRFPGQWFQLETGLAYNWHRHYDATLGRYVQPDPLRVDDLEGQKISGIASTLRLHASLPHEIYQQWGATYFGAPPGVMAAASSTRSINPDGPSIYGYSTQNPSAKIDRNGLFTGGPYTPRPKSPLQSCVAANDNCFLLLENVLTVDGNAQLNCHYLCNNGTKKFSLFVGDWAYPKCPPSPPSGAF